MLERLAPDFCASFCLRKCYLFFCAFFPTLCKAGRQKVPKLAVPLVADVKVTLAVRPSQASPNHLAHPAHSQIATANIVRKLFTIQLSRYAKRNARNYNRCPLKWCIKASPGSRRNKDCSLKCSLMSDVVARPVSTTAFCSAGFTFIPHSL